MHRSESVSPIRLARLSLVTCEMCTGAASNTSRIYDLISSGGVCPASGTRLVEAVPSVGTPKTGCCVIDSRVFHWLRLCCLVLLCRRCIAKHTYPLFGHNLASLRCPCAASVANRPEFPFLNWTETLRGVY